MISSLGQNPDEEQKLTCKCVTDLRTAGLNSFGDWDLKRCRSRIS